MDHFRNFRGFGGQYLSHHKEEPIRVAERLLEKFRGQTVQLVYNEIAEKYMPVFRYDQSGMFKPHKDFVNVPKEGSLEGFLNGVKTDNILLLGDNESFELQRIVIGNQFVTEVDRV
ncbi:MAG: hypothetical protein AABX35_02155 [Nanoarchaeota archaeon]